MECKILQLSIQVRKCVIAHCRGGAGDAELNDQAEHSKETKGNTLSNKT